MSTAPPAMARTPKGTAAASARPRLTIVTNAGGPGVLATDALIPNGGELTLLSQESLSALNGLLPSHWSHANPIDILGDADPELYEKAVKIAIADPLSDGLLVVLAPQGMTNPAEVARRLAPYAQGQGKPVLASWMGGQTVAEGEAILECRRNSDIRVSRYRGARF
jgi:acetyltransferase